MNDYDRVLKIAQRMWFWCVQNAEGDDVVFDNGFEIRPEEIVAIENSSTDIEFNRLLEIANQLHLLIFLNTYSEEDIFRELNLTTEENYLLGWISMKVGLNNV